MKTTIKNHLDNLKKTDYIAWDSLVNDPMITGKESDSGYILPIVLFIIIIIIFLTIK